MANLVIKVETAAEQLGLTIEDFRKLLEVFYPKSWQTIKQISKKNFKTISEQLMEAALAQPENESVDVETIETEIQNQQTLLQETEDDYSIDDNSDTATDISNDSWESPESSDEQEDQESEDSALANIPAEELDRKIKMQIELALPNQVLDLQKITRVLAIASADEVVTDFAQLYTHRVNTGINSFIKEFGNQTIASIAQLRDSSNEDFLAEVGKIDNQNGRHELIEKITNLIG